MLGPYYMYVQGSGWGSCAMLNRSHYLCICGWTGLSTGATHFRLCVIENIRFSLGLIATFSLEITWVHNWKLSYPNL